MSRRRLSITPGTAIALVALFFALGGSAFAVGERIQSPSVAQQRCTNGAVRGFASVTGDPSKGMANLPDKFSSANVLFTRKFNCTGRAVQVRRRRHRRLRGALRWERRGDVLANGIGLFSASVELIRPAISASASKTRTRRRGRGPFIAMVI